MGLTEPVLGRPVSTVLVALCLIVFDLSSMMKLPPELAPGMNVSMMIVMTVYSGASPDDVSELVTRPIEDRTNTLNGLDTISSRSKENMSTVMLKYKYGTNVNDAYDDLKKQMDLTKVELLEDVDDPIMLELNTSPEPDVTVAVNHGEDDNLYDHVNNEIIPEFEKLSIAVKVSITGGLQRYIKVGLMPRKLKRYGASMSSAASGIVGLDIIYPAGDMQVGDQKLSMPIGQPFGTMDSLNDIPLTVPGGQTVHLSDAAKVYMGTNDVESTAHCKAESGLPGGIMALTVSKQQGAATLNVPKDVKQVANKLTIKDPSLQITVVDNDKGSITSSLSPVIETTVLTTIISMIIIWLFFGDLKVPMIVDSPIPVPILSSPILMQLMGFNPNAITLSALVLGVGTMVDSSTAVLESCFRATDDTGFRELSKAALNDIGVVYQSVIDSTLTICAVLLPLAMLGGMTGQMLRSLGFTTVFCMTASLVLAITVVPLCYMTYRPMEKKIAPLSRPVEKMQEAYRGIMTKLPNKRGLVVLTSVMLFLFSFFIAKFLHMEMMVGDDQGQISTTAEAKPGMIIDKVDHIMKQIGDIISQQGDVESYTTPAGNSRLSTSSDPSITIYLKKDRKTETDEVVCFWKQQLGGISDTSITVEVYSQVSAMMDPDDEYSVDLRGTNYDDLKAINDQLAENLSRCPELARVHSNLENVTPVVKATVNPIKAGAARLTPVQIGGILSGMPSGTTSTFLNTDRNGIDVKVGYPKEHYKTLDQTETITLQTPKGSSMALTDVADIHFADSPASTTRQDEQYRATISGIYTEDSDENTEALFLSEVAQLAVSDNANVTITQNRMDGFAVEEFTALFQTTAPAIFLVFVVMAAQFGSPKFSIMVMTTIPFCLVGAFGLLQLAGSAISVTSLPGFLMPVSMVINNGTLHVDTVSQYRKEMDLGVALVEMGATCLKSILMTALATAVFMVPMTLALGDSGSTTQGLAFVNTDGLTVSTIPSLLMSPAYYSPMNGGEEKRMIAADQFGCAKGMLKNYRFK